MGSRQSVIAGRSRPEYGNLEFEAMVMAEAAGEVAPGELEVLKSDVPRWRAALERLLDDTEDSLDSVRMIPGEERDQVVADFEEEWETLIEALERLTGESYRPEPPPEPVRVAQPAAAAPREISDDDVPGAGVRRLQLTWEPGRVVAWAGGPGIDAGAPAEVLEMLVATGAPRSAWVEHPAVRLPRNERADALAVPVGQVLGWLVAIGADPGGHDVAASVRWLARLATIAVRHVAQGRTVPTLRQAKHGRNKAEGEESLSVRWIAALINGDQLDELARTMPGAVAASEPGVDGATLTRSVLASMVDTVCREAAARVEVPAPPPEPETAMDVAEAFLARLDGARFDAPGRHATELVARLQRWARPVAPGGRVKLLVQLDPPSSSGGWYLSVQVCNTPRPVPLEVALVTFDGGRRRGVQDELNRLERLLPVLTRPGGQRRGEVILDQDEAWELMSSTGSSLDAAGFEVRVPNLSRQKLKPSLRLSAEDFNSAVAGAQQLTAVRWSVAFGDVELSAADIMRLAAEARPLVRSHGQWVALDRADLAEAAAALAERAHLTQMTGAAMLRHALGLEGTSLAGGISLGGSGWAVDLFQRASSVREPMAAPEGFQGELRSYQSEALAWLSFLDVAGLGGCLALDMGLGKTPTMLAHLQTMAGGEAPALVIAPPAVVGNWAAEAAKFTPQLRVVVHHGGSRADADELAAVAANADVVLTTYGTAVRDIDAISALQWQHVVLDEAQAIKNPTSDTAQQLRRINARTRVALTGTPIENGLGDLWAIMDFTNPGLVGARPQFVSQLSRSGDGRAAAEDALRALNGILVFRRTKAEPAIAAELPPRIDELDRCSMTPEQIGLYQAVLDDLVAGATPDEEVRKGQVLAAITALKQICNHPSAYQSDDAPLEGRSGKLARLEEITHAVFAAGEKLLVFTHFAQWGIRLAAHLTERTGLPVECYHGGLTRTARDRMVADFQTSEGPGALVLSLKAGGTGLNLTGASHVVLYDRWWNPAVEDQARDRAWRIGQERTVVCHRLVCPGTIDERVEEVVAGKRRIADLVLPKSSSVADLNSDQLRVALGLRPDQLVVEDITGNDGDEAEAA